MSLRPGAWLRIALVALLAASFALGLFALGVRYYLLPRADTYRPAVERVATRVMQTPVRIERIEGRWGGWRPHLDVTGVRVTDARGVDVLTVPRAQLALSWRSLVSWRLDLSDLRVQGATVLARRDHEGVWTVAGRRVERNADGGRLLDNPAWQWVLAQPRMTASGATLVIEDARIAPHRWVFPAIEARTRHRGIADVSFRARAQLPEGHGGTLTAEGRLGPSLRRYVDADAPAWRGSAEIAAQDVALAALAGLLPAEARLDGRAGLRGQLDFTDLALGVWSADVEVTDLSVGLARGAGHAASATAQLRGSFDERALAGAVRLRDAGLSLPDVFEQPDIPVHSLEAQLDLRFTPGEPLRLGFEDLRADAGEAPVRALVSARGVWRPDGRTRAGTLQLEAATDAIDAAAIARYMPRVVGPGVRRWLREGLVAGRLSGVSATVRGDLADFPFDETPTQGEFRIAGRVDDAVIDVAPQAERRWPAFEAVAGHLVVERASLSAEVESAQVSASLPAAVAIDHAHIEIPDLHAGAVMTLQAEAHGPAQAFLAYVANTRLADFTGGFLSLAQASGELRVPARVVVPFGALERLEVEGEVHLAGNTVALHPSAPALVDSQGVVTFSHASVGAREVRAQFLGRPLTADGEMPLAGGQGIRVRGGVAAAALRRHWGDHPALARLDGATGFDAVVASGPTGPGLVLQSELVGLGLDLPAPLRKAADEPWPLRVRLARGEQPRVRRLDVELPGRLALAAEFGADTGTRPLRASLGVGRDAPLPRQGMNVQVAGERLDLGEWAGVLMAASGGQGGGAPSERADAMAWLAEAPLQASLRAGRADAMGLRFDDLNLTLTRAAGRGWQGRVRARQADGRFEVAGGLAAVRGEFRRLALQPAQEGAPGQAAGDADAAQPARLPDLSLDVADFSLRDWRLGRLRLRATNQPGARAAWRIDTFVLENPAARMEASGEWRAQAARAATRRTTLDVSVDVRDAGALAERLGLPGTLAGGRGYVKGSVGWAGHPFSYRAGGTDLHLGVALDEGRFLKAPDSRLLGILSLQTLARTAAFPQGGLFASGFAWDSLRAEVSASEGVAQLESFSLRGPSATVVMSGSLDLVRHTQALRAVIVPHVDASAAALLAGVAINPLVGAGAFLAQLLLREPLSQAFTFEYAISGSWDEPKVERLASPVAAEATPAAP